MYANDGDCLIDRLPNEIWQQIFAYIYPPFHLRYTQTHDHYPLSDWEQALERASVHDLNSQSLLHELPRIGPLLVNKKFYDVGNGIFQSAFTRYVHIVGRMIYKTVHHSYSGLMAITKDIVIAEEYLWTFLSLNFSLKMPQLQRIIALMKFMTRQSLMYELVDGTIYVKAINYDDKLWEFVSTTDLFEELAGMASDTHALRKTWEHRGIKTAYRYVRYAAAKAVKIEECHNLLVSGFSYT